jgi:cytochrome c oxidase cbb3-type subunit 4
VNSLRDYFHTDWAAMTLHDWLGMSVTVIVFLIMCGLFAYVMHPSNKQRFENQRRLPSEDDEINMEVKK